MSRQLAEWVLHAALQHASRPALNAAGLRLTYSELVARAAQAGHALVQAGIRPGDRVGILLEKSPEAILAILGTLFAGGVYVPLDPSSPAPRLARILAAATPSVVFVSPHTHRLGAAGQRLAGAQLRFATLAAAGVPECAFGAREAASESPHPRLVARSPEAAAHLLFTSGSTGTPKGVVITHANVLAFLAWAVPHFGIAPTDRCSSHPPLHFDLSTFDLYGTFGSGAELYLVPPEVSLLPHKLAEFIRTSELTQWFSVPSILTYLVRFDAIRPRDFPALRRLLWCGEVLPTPILIHLMRHLPHVRFTNLYGPTEATIASTFHDVPGPPADPRVPVPIGRPCAGEEALVLDAELRETPPDAVGELYLGGPGLSPGYWQDPDKTRAAFVPDPRRPGQRLYRTGDLARRDADGLLHFVGRSDMQIKSRGYRIELGEIEAALHTLPGLRESAVVAIPTGGFEGHRICCAYALLAGQSLEPAAVRKALAELLPGYMLPARFLVLPELPKNQNGKIDRPALRQLFASAIDS